MKVTQIFGLVLLFHLAAIGLILLQPGCQNQPRPAPPEGATETGSEPAPSATSGGSMTRADYVPPADRQAPQRPGGSTSSTASGAASATRGVDPAFNAGLSGPGSGLLQPMLEPSVDLGSDSSSGSDSGSGASGTTYTVRAGDNLTKIARSHGVTVAEIRQANGLSSSTIRVGQELDIPAPSAPVRSADVDAAGSVTYTVRSGDTLSGIASRHGVTVRELKSANSLNSDTIRVGQDLYIPGGSQSSSSASSSASRGASSPAPSAAGSGNTYTVQSGDTPGGIARRFGVDYRELMRLNNIPSANRMQVGQTLIIPGGGTSSPSNNSATSGNSTASRSSGSSGATNQSASTPRPTTLNPQPSEPARIGSGNQDAPPPADDFDLLESNDLPLMDVEVIEGNNGN